MQSGVKGNYSMKYSMVGNLMRCLKDGRRYNTAVTQPLHSTTEEITAVTPPPPHLHGL